MTRMRLTSLTQAVIQLCEQPLLRTLAISLAPLAVGPIYLLPLTDASATNATAVPTAPNAAAINPHPQPPQEIETMTTLNAATPEGVAPKQNGNGAKQKGKSHKGTGLRKDLSMSENYALMKLMEAEYTSSGMNDTEFAEYAMTKIKLRPGSEIKNHNIKQRRDSMGIKGNRGQYGTKKETNDDLEALASMVLAQERRIAELEEQLTSVVGWVNSTFPTKGLKKQV